MKNTVLIVGLCAALTAGAQSPENDKAVIETRKLIQEQEDNRYRAPSDDKIKTMTEEDIAAPIAESMVKTDAAVDAFIRNNVSADNLDRESTEKRIRAILGKAGTQETEYAGVPYVFVSDAAGLKSLLVGYELDSFRMGDSEVTIRAYKSDGEHLKLTAETGSDIDKTLIGHSLFMREVPSPVSGETWLLTWGAEAGSNQCGSWDLRLYGYDGTKFRTIWKEDNDWCVSVVLTRAGFNIHHIDRTHQNFGFYRTYEYQLTPAGPKLIASIPDKE